ncbi:MAG: signal peptidase I [Parcubacteria bacterium C7867-003]|nr:MAG: signal peptidase I [Parcubacteria bacterium C7867-003]
MIDEKIPPESIRPPHLIDKLKKEDSEIKKGIKWKEIFKEIPSIALILLAVIGFRIYVAEPYLVDGRSMDPTFHTRDYLIVDKISSKAKRPERNAVVVFNAANAGQPKRSFIKRIIGLPGETVIVKGNTVKIISSENPDGFMLEQPYVTHQSTQDIEKTLGENQYFVMGDNRKDSYDSRYWGALDQKYILGRPIIQLFPISKIGLSPGNN